MGEQLQTEILERALSDPADEVGLRVGSDRIDDRRGQERNDDQVERAGVVALNPVVDRQLCERGGG